MSYKNEIKYAMRYYNHWLSTYKQEKKEEQEDIKEIERVIKQLRIEISELYKELDLMDQTTESYIENYTRKYIILRNKEDEKRMLIGDKNGSNNAIKRLEAKNKNN